MQDMNIFFYCRNMNPHKGTQNNTACFLKTVPSAICVWDRYTYIVIIKIVYTEGTDFMKPAVKVE